MLSRNAYASGDLALPLGIWHFACKSHVDVKRVYTRFGSTVSDSTARKALNSTTAASMRELQADVSDAAAKGESAVGKILDNVQQNSPVYEHGLGRENQLIVGTACTVFYYEDSKPGAWYANDHITRVCDQQRQEMTTENVYESIDWSHVWTMSELQFVRVVANYSPVANKLRHRPILACSEYNGNIIIIIIIIKLFPSSKSPPAPDLRSLSDRTHRKASDRSRTANPGSRSVNKR